MSTPIEEMVTTQIENEIVQFIDAGNLLELFPSPPTIADITVEDLVWRYLKDVAEASLTTRGWHPNRTKIYIEQLAQRVFSTGLEADLEWMDWRILEKIGVKLAGFEKIAKKPGKQMSHYFFTGLGLDVNGNRYPRPYSLNYNFLVEPGTGSGSIGRPLQCGNAAGGLWGVVTNFILSIDVALGALVSKGFEKANLLVFYPRIAEQALIHQIDSGGTGLKSAQQYFIDSGVSADRIIAIDDIYLPTDPTGTPVTPTLDDFDIIIVDASEVRILHPQGENVGKTWANVFVPNPGSAKPKVTIEAGMDACPIFIPHEIKSEGKIYKGVYVINGIDKDAT